MRRRILALALFGAATAFCPKVEPLERDSPECPDELDLPACDKLPNPQVGDFCEGDGECGTDKGENNCRNAEHSSADIYKVVSLEGGVDDGGGGDAPPEDNLGPCPGPDHGNGATGLAPVGPGTDYECPKDGEVKKFSCRDKSLRPGDYCQADKNNDAECGTDKNLDNCEYKPGSGKLKDIYILEGEVEVPEGCPTLALAGDGTDYPCPEDGTVFFFDCSARGLKANEYCKSNNGECLTSKEANNCFYQGSSKADIYYVLEPAEGGGRECAVLKELTKGSAECPDGVDDMVACDDPDLEVGDYCEGDGECETNKGANNCPNAAGKLSADVYKVIALPGEDAPEDDDDTPPPADDDDDDETDDEPAPPDDDDDPTDDEDDDDDNDQDAVPPVADDDFDDEAEWHVDTEIRFIPPVARTKETEDQIAQALVEAGVVSSRNEVKRVMWHANQDVDEEQFSRRRLYETSPARASLNVFASDFSQAERGMDGQEVIISRLKQAVDDDELLDALMSQNEALGNAFDGEATAGLANKDTIIRNGAPPYDDDPERVTDDNGNGGGGGGGGGSKKKKSSSDIISGMDDAGAIVLILFLVLVGICCLAALAFGMYYYLMKEDDDHEQKTRAFGEDDEYTQAQDTYAPTRATQDERTYADDDRTAASRTYAGETRASSKWPENEDDASSWGAGKTGVTGAEETKYNESFRYGGASVATGAAGGATVASARSARSGRSRGGQSRGGRSTGSHNMDMDMSDDDSSYNMA